MMSTIKPVKYVCLVQNNFWSFRKLLCGKEGITNDFIISLLCLQPESQVHVHWKGATETVFASYAWYIDATDQLVALDEDEV